MSLTSSRELSYRGDAASAIGGKNVRRRSVIVGRAGIEVRWRARYFGSPRASSPVDAARGRPHANRLLDETIALLRARDQARAQSSARADVERGR